MNKVGTSGPHFKTTNTWSFEDLARLKERKLNPQMPKPEVTGGAQWVMGEPHNDHGAPHVCSPSLHKKNTFLWGEPPTHWMRTRRANPVHPRLGRKSGKASVRNGNSPCGRSHPPSEEHEISRACLEAAKAVPFLQGTFLYTFTARAPRFMPGAPACS